jgi:PAS domain S-box-containing protein
MKDNTVKRIIGLFVAALAVLVFVAVISVRNIRRAIASSDWVNHTHAVILEANATASSLHAGDAALRTYLMTGDRHDQGSYRTDYSKMVEHLETALALTRDEPAQHEIFLQLEQLIRERVNFAREVVQARKRAGLAGATRALAAHPDQESLAAIQRLNRKLNGQENDLLRDRDRDSHLQAQTTRWTVMAGVAINFLLLAFVSWLISDDIAARRRAAAVLEEANAQLEAKVQERTAELVKTNQSLKVENLERRWSGQALEHQLRYSQLIINSIGDLIFVVSKALNVSRVNPAVEKQTGWEPQELITQSIARVLQLPPGAASGAPSMQNQLAFALKEGREIQERPATVLCKDGQTRAVHFSLFPLHDQDKIVGGIITVGLSPASISKT